MDSVGQHRIDVEAGESIELMVTFAAEVDHQGKQVLEFGVKVEAERTVRNFVVEVAEVGIVAVGREKPAAMVAIVADSARIVNIGLP